MAKIHKMRDYNGAQFYPEVHEKAVVDSNGVTLDTKLDAIVNRTFKEAWDGSSTPVVAEIPAGVVVTYNSQSYTGTLAASAATAPFIYMVADGNGNYDRYVSELSGSSYVWKYYGNTEIDLSDYATKDDLSQLDQEMNGGPALVYSGMKTYNNEWCNKNTSKVTFAHPIPAGQPFSVKVIDPLNQVVVNPMYFFKSDDSEYHTATQYDTNTVYTFVLDFDLYGISINSNTGNRVTGDVGYEVTSGVTIGIRGEVDEVKTSINGGDIVLSKLAQYNNAWVNRLVIADITIPESTPFKFKFTDNGNQLSGACNAVYFYREDGTWENNSGSFSEDVQYSFTRQFKIVGIALNYATAKITGTITYQVKIADSGLESAVKGDGNDIYFGDKRIILNPLAARYNMTRETLYSEALGTGNVHKLAQSMAIYDDKAFVVIDNALSQQPDTNVGVAIFDMANDFALLGTSELPFRAHNANAQFSDVFYAGSDPFPLLLVSRGDSSLGSQDLEVLRISVSGGAYSFSVVKTIHCTLPAAVNQGLWVADFQNKRLYLYTMTAGIWTVTEGNNRCIYAFEMPDITDANLVTLAESDVVGYCELEYGIWQGADCFAGKIWAAVQAVTSVNGIPVEIPNKIIEVIDPVVGCVDNVIPSDLMENEGLSIYDGHVFLCCKNSSASAATDVCLKVVKFTF